MALWKRKHADRRDVDGRRRPASVRPIAAAVFLVAVVVAAVLTVVDGAGRKQPSHADGGEVVSVASASPGPATSGIEAPLPGSVPSVTGSRGPAPSMSPLPPPGADRPCTGPESKDTAIPQHTPADLTWTSFGGMMLPASRMAGPAGIEGDVARCYAHTPLGALLASVQISSRLFLTPAWRSVVERSVVPGAERDQLVDQRGQAEKTHGTPRPPAAGRLLQIAGYQFVSYSGDTAVVKVLKGTPGAQGTPAQFKSVLYTMTWHDGDWKLRLAADGRDSFMVQELDSAAGFVPWGPTVTVW